MAKIRFLDQVPIGVFATNNNGNGNNNGSFSGSFTGSLLGTASWANNAITASYLLGSIENAVYALTSSFSTNITGSTNYIPVYKNNNGLISSTIYQSGSFTSIRNSTTPPNPSNPDILYINGEGIGTYNIISAHSDLNNYIQLNIQNFNPGETSSSDIVATADIGNESDYYIDMGINGSGYNDPNGIGNALDAYLYSTGQDLLIGNATGGNKIIIFNGDGPALNNARVFIDSIGTVGINDSNPTINNPEALLVSSIGSSSVNLISGKANINNYTQLNLKNQSSGISASSDIVATADNGTETIFYIDMGINSSNYIDNGNGIGSANDGYLYTIGKGLLIGNASSSYVSIFAGGFNSDVHRKLLINYNNNHELTGSLNISGSLTAPSITGSLLGTASWANNAITASYVSSTQNTVSASYAATASFYNGPVISASYAATASISISSSYSTTSNSSSFALTASYVANASSFPYTGSALITGSLSITGSLNITGSDINIAQGSNIITHHIKAAGSNGLEILNNAGNIVGLFGAGGGLGTTFNGQVNGTIFSGSLLGTASYASNALSASYFSGSILNVASSSYAATASFVQNAVSASNAATASFYGGNVTSASYATTASFYGGSVISSSYSSTASFVQNAVSASYVQIAQTSSISSTSSLPLLGIITASVSNTTITFTKGDGSQFNITVSQSGSVSTSSYALFAEQARTSSYAATASFVQNAVSASNAQTASFYGGSVISSSYAATASFVQNAISASYVQTSQTASFVQNSISASYSATASFYGGNVTSASYAATSSFVQNAVSASYVQTSQTASFVQNAISSSFSSTASFYGGNVISSSYASTASFVQNAISASYVQTAQTASFYGGNVTSASYAATASFVIGIITSASYAATASFVQNAVSASYVQTAQTASFYGGNVTSASFSSTASFVQNAISASYVRTAQTASFVQNAISASYSSTSSFFTGTIISSSYSTTSSFVQNAISASYALFATTTLSSSYAGTASILLGSIESASYAATASYVANAASFPYQGNAFISGSLTVQGSGSVLLLISGSQGQLLSVTDANSDSNVFSITSGSVTILNINGSKVVSISGSLVVTGSLTGSILGTASYSNTSLSSSYAGTASILLGSVVSASYAATSSFFTGTVISSSYAGTASILLGSIESASYAATSSLTVTASYAITASYALNGGGPGATFPYTGSATISGSLNVDGSGSFRASQSNAVLTLVDATANTNAIFAMESPIGGTPQLGLTVDRFVVNGTTRLVGAFEMPGGFNVNSSTFYGIGSNDIYLQTDVLNVNVIHGGRNKSTEINSYTGYDLYLNPTGSNNNGGGGNVIIGNPSISPAYKLNVSGSINSTNNILVGGGVGFYVLVASENLAAGDFVNIHSGGVRKAYSDDTSKQAHGFVLDTITSGNSASVYFSGLNNAGSGFTVGSTYYLSTSGSESTTPPTTGGQLSQRLGVAIATNTILVNLDQPIIT